MGQRSSGRDGYNGGYDPRAAFRIEEPKVYGGSGSFAKTAVFGLGGSRFGVCQKRRGDKGVVVRRIMLFMAFFVLAICPFIFAFFGDIPIAVETVQQSGGWLWGLVPEKETFGIAYINGFYMADVWKELMANLISAYIGAGITRKAFTLGK